MKGIIRRLRPSPAMVVACIALVFAMTGAGYAAGMLGPNTVGTKQLKKNAVISSKVKNHSLLAADFKSGQLPRGAQGPQGPQGPQGIQGIQGPAGPYPDLLPAGKTVRGNYVEWVHSASAGVFILAPISYGFRLPSAPAVHYIQVGDPATPECPGSVTDPQAAPGNFCAYESQATNVSAPRRTCDPEVNGCPFASSNREGIALAALVTNTGLAGFLGSWAVTAGSSMSPNGSPHKPSGGATLSH